MTAYQRRSGEVLAPIMATSSITLPSHFTTDHFQGQVQRAPAISISLLEISTLPKVDFPSNLGEKLLGDVLVAASVTAVVAPFLTIVDKALVQRSAGSHTIFSSAVQSIGGMLRNPVAYFRSPTYLWMWATYAATYSAANSLRTLTEHQEYTATRKGSSSQAATGTLFVGTTAVNSGASLVKDRAYARLFGSATTGAVVPRVSYGLWMARDFTVIGSSFVLPDHVSKFLQDKTGMKEEDALKAAQFGTPVAAQLVAGPLHFLGLDCYNRKLGHLDLSTRVLERSRFLASGFAEVVAARMARIIPGYGIAGVWNTQLRGQWRDYLIHRQVCRMTATSSPPREGISALVALIRAKEAA